jgi:hypothetical protein
MLTWLHSLHSAEAGAVVAAGFVCALSLCLGILRCIPSELAQKGGRK